MDPPIREPVPFATESYLGRQIEPLGESARMSNKLGKRTN